MKKTLGIAALLTGLSSAALSQVGAPPAPGEWDLYRGSTRLSSHPDMQACIDAAHAKSAASSYSCRPRVAPDSATQCGNAACANEAPLAGAQPPAQLPPTAAGTYLLFDDADLARWKQRAASGPFKVAGDAFPGSPGDWTRIIANAEAAVRQGLEANERHISTDDHYPYSNFGARARDAAFAYLITGDSRYQSAARTQLLTMLRQPQHDIANYNFNPGFARDGMVAQAMLGQRMVFLYAMLRPSLSDADRAFVEAKFAGWGAKIAAFHADRLVTDLGPRINARNVEWSGGDPSAYAYVDASGTPQARIPALATSYTNRRTMTLMLLGLIGVQLGNATWAGAAKEYVHQWLAYGVHPSGAQGDYTRNGDYNVQQQGRMYSAMVNQAVLYFAEALRRTGDTSLYTFSTSAGKSGWEGGPKSVALAIDAHLALIAKERQWYSASRGPASPRTPATRLGLQTIGGVDKCHDIGYVIGKAGLPSLAPRIDAIVKRDNTKYPNVDRFPGSTGAPVDCGNSGPYVDPLGVLPAPLFMFG